MSHSTPNPALVMLEMQRAAHAALSNQPPTFGTVRFPSALPPNEESDGRVRLSANRELTAAIPAERRLNIIYAPLLAKTLCSDICQTIEQMLKQNNVTDTKADTAFLKHWREEWQRELYSPDMPKDAEDTIRTLTQWWRDDGTDNILKQLRFAYSNHLGRIKGIQSNTADFLAWIFTAREIARASARFDDTSLQYLKSIPQSKPFNLRRNASDYAYKLQEFATRLVVSAFGHDYEPDDKDIATGRNALFNRLALYDAVTALSEYWAHDGVQRARKQCPADRCHLCTLRDECKTLKSVTKKMHQS